METTRHFLRILLLFYSLTPFVSTTILYIPTDFYPGESAMANVQSAVPQCLSMWPLGHLS